MNKVILMGRLTRDPDIRYTQGENSMAVARYSLAVDRRRANSDGTRETDFINCVAFGKQAEFAERYLHQGTKIAITGRIQTGNYVNKDGQKVYTTDIVVEEQEFAESKAATDNRQSGSGFQQYQAQPQTTAQPAGHENRIPAETEASVGEGFMNIPEGVEDEGLPFN